MGLFKAETPLLDAELPALRARLRVLAAEIDTAEGEGDAANLARRPHRAAAAIERLLDLRAERDRVKDALARAEERERQLLERPLRRELAEAVRELDVVLTEAAKANARVHEIWVRAEALGICLGQLFWHELLEESPVAESRLARWRRECGIQP